MCLAGVLRRRGPLVHERALIQKGVEVLFFELGRVPNLPELLEEAFAASVVLADILTFFAFLYSLIDFVNLHLRQVLFLLQDLLIVLDLILVKFLGVDHSESLICGHSPVDQIEMVQKEEKQGYTHHT